MPVPVANTFRDDVHNLAKTDTKKADGPIGPQVSELAQYKNLAKKQLNSSILESTINLSTGDSPQALVLKAALEGINEALSASLGADAIQHAYAAGLDVSPEATANRIVSLSTAFFPQYQAAHNEFDDNVDAARAAFIDVIRGGVETGFAEAKDILDALDVLNGEIASNIDKTYELVQEQLDAFVLASNKLEQNNIPSGG
ncbi:MAG: hypothetical protein COB26_11230 [Piscirickettsiaceae bacterium]|nr:MAG: hypothetical protein COB26_11230 [Piscirickettsiaceae bacterium]